MNNMISKEQIKKQLAEIGILSTDTVLIHTSFKAVGPVEGGPDGFIDTFCEYLSEGTFIVPTHTWGVINKDNNVFDVRKTVPNIGLIPRTAAFRKDGVRSLHPTHSVWVHGKMAEALIEKEENAFTPGGEGFFWDRLGDIGAKILLIGVGNDKNTFIHSIEERAHIENRIGQPYDVKIVDHNSNEKWVKICPHYCTETDDVSQYFTNFDKPLTETGCQYFGKIGNATVRVVDAKKCRQLIQTIFTRAESDIFLEHRELPENLWQ